MKSKTLNKIMVGTVSALLIAPTILAPISAYAEEVVAPTEEVVSDASQPVVVPEVPAVVEQPAQDVVVDGGTVEETPVVQAQVQDVQIEYPEEVVEAQEVATQEAVYTEQAQAQVARVQAAPKASETYYGNATWTQDQEGVSYVTFSNGETAEVSQRNGYIRVFFTQTGIGSQSNISTETTGTFTDTLNYTETGNTYVITVTVLAKQEPEIPTEAKAPTNISYDGEYLYAVGSDGDKMMAYDASGNSISYYAFGEGGNSQSTFDLKRPLKSGEKIYVVAYDSYGNESAKSWFTNEAIKEVSNRVLGMDVDSGAELYSTTEKGLPGTTKTVTAQTVDGYNLVGDKTQTLTFGENGDVVFQYKKKDTTPEPVKTTKLTVKYLDGDKKEIATSTVTTEESGKEISVTAKDVKGYTLVGDKTVNVTPTGDTQTVTFSYTKDAVIPDPVKKTQLTVQYLDESGKAVATETVSEVESDKEISVTAKDVKGYTVKGAKTVKVTPTGSKDKVVFTYTKDAVTPDPVKKTKLTVKYVDDANKPLATETVSEVETGKETSVTAKEIAGYTVKGEKTVKVTPKGDTQSVTFTYTKNAVTPDPVKKTKLVVEYLEELSLKELAKPVVSEVETGKPVTVKAKEIKGYTLVGQSEYTITPDSEAHKITFIYVKDAEVPTVIANATEVSFVKDSDGKQIQANVPGGLQLVIVKNGEIIGESVATTSKSVNTIVTLTEQVKAGESVTYYTRNADGNTSVEATLTREGAIVDPTEPTEPTEPTTPTEPTEPTTPTTPTDDGKDNGGTVTPKPEPTTPSTTDSGTTTTTTTDTSKKDTVKKVEDAKKAEELKKSGKKALVSSGLVGSLLGISAVAYFVDRKKKAKK